MSLTNEDDGRSAAIAELILAVENKLDELVRGPAASRILPSALDITYTHMTLPLAEVPHWPLGESFTHHENPDVTHLLPGYLDLILRTHSHFSIALWIREDQRFAITYLNPINREKGYELLDLAPMKLEGIKALTELLRTPTNKEES